MRLENIEEITSETKLCELGKAIAAAGHFDDRKSKAVVITVPPHAMNHIITRSALRDTNIFTYGSHRFHLFVDSFMKEEYNVESITDRKL